MVKYLWGTADFARSAFALAAASVSPNQYRLTVSLRRFSSAAARGLVLAGLLATLLVSTSFRFGESPALGALTLVVPTVRYGLETERFAVVNAQVAAADTDLEDLLRDRGVRRVTASRLASLADNSVAVYDVAERPYTEFRDAGGDLAHLAIDINAHEYMRVDLPTGTIAIADREGVTAEYTSAALFYDGDVDAMLEHTSFDAELAARVRHALTHDLPLDDAFASGIVRLIYTVKRDDAGAVIGHGDVEAIRYRVGGEDKTAIRFDDADLAVEGFFTPEGAAARRSWLTTPVPGARLSSPFNLRRRHPVLRRVKPHYGTDYAAPYGTPILAVSDGVVSARARTRGNGNFVKIKHDERYQTQYLHMKAFAKGIKPGVAVRKGQVIGYVGSTGLSSGPHVCFRFWKDGKQVDHRAEHLPTADDLSAEAFDAFAEKQAAISAMFEARA